MKKVLSFMAVLSLLMGFQQNAFAYYSHYVTAPSGQRIYYEINNNNTVRITSPCYTSTYDGAQNPWGNYTKPTGNLIIPDSIGSYPVVAIDNYSFRTCTEVTSVSIPNTVITIGSYAFGGCIGLTGALTIPNSVTSIGSCAFNGCNSLTSLTIGNSVISIGDYAFSGCTGFSGTLTLPNSITTIGSNAFYGCCGFSGTLVIPNSVTTFGSNTFSECIGFTSVVFNAENCTSGGYMGSDNSTIYAPFINLSNITSFTFGSNVKYIPAYLCYGLSGLTSLTIPDSVSYIGNAAFRGCTGLTTVVFNADSCTYGKTNDRWWYEYPAFDGLDNITSLTFGENVKVIPDFLCSWLTGLTTVTIPNSVKYIGNSAFRKCYLTSVFFNADSCTYAGKYEYHGLGYGAYYEDYPAFSNAYGDNDIGNDYTSIIFGNNVKVIPPNLCYKWRYLDSVTIPNSVATIGDNAFYDCNNLRKTNYTGTLEQWNAITINNYDGSNPIKYSKNLFLNDALLTDLVFPDTTTVIKTNLQYDTALHTVTIPNSVTTINNLAFIGCTGLTKTNYMGTDAQWAAINIMSNPIEFSKNLYLNDVLLTDIVFPSTTTIIYRNFENDTAIHSVTIPNSVTAISYHAFNNCTGLRKIYALPTTPPTMGSDVFLNVNPYARIIVPRDSYNTYVNRWSQYQNMIRKDQYVVTAQSNDNTIGSVSGSGTYNWLDTVEITATPIEHYHFVMWSNGSRDNPRQFVIENDINLTATFAIDTHTVTVVIEDFTRGSVTGDGEYVYGTPCVLTALAYEGYTFAGWSNGVTSNPYAFAVQSDVELTALFIAEGEELYTVTVVSADPAKGSVSGGGQAMDGGSVVIRAAGNPGYHFVRWNDNNTDSVRTVEVHADVTYTAYFAANVGIDDVAAKGIRMYAGDGEIVLEGSEGMAVSVYDMMGRKVFSVMAAPEPCKVAVLQRGVYLVKVGNLPARKVVVIR